jgi:hypothetical protein
LAAVQGEMRSARIGSSLCSVLTFHVFDAMLE